jgi:hypothetical protein
MVQGVQALQDGGPDEINPIDVGKSLTILILGIPAL